MKYTKGPWKLRGKFSIKGQDGKPIVVVRANQKYRFPKSEDEANAVLISLAPQMAELLQSIRNEILLDLYNISEKSHKNIHNLIKLMPKEKNE